MTTKKGNAWGLMKQMDEFISQATGERCKIMVAQREYLLGAYCEVWQAFLQRLIEAERKRNPDKSEIELCEDAIDRVKRNRGR